MLTYLDTEDGSQFTRTREDGSFEFPTVLAGRYPTLDTFRTFLSDSNPNYPSLTNLMCAAKAPGLEVLHG